MNKSNSNPLDWDLRAEILGYSHRWPLTLLAFLLGSLIGLGLSYLLPTTSRAEAGLSVVYNADVYPNNPDDFKNWYLEQLDVFILSDAVLDETLSRLGGQGAAWEGITREDLRERLHAYWRSAGQWRLVAEAHNPEEANRLAETWKEVILDQVTAATGQAASMLFLTHQHQQASQAEVAAQMRSLELASAREALQAWKDNPSQAPVTELERWRLLSLVATAASFNETGQALLASAPPPGSAGGAYAPWIEEALLLLEGEAATLQTQQATLANQRLDIQQSWTEASRASHGLSAYLLVTELPAANQSAQPVRQPSGAALVGGIVGVLAWSLFWLGRSAWKAKP
jgi:hypothetical protein